MNRVNEMVYALRKCAKEHENDVGYTGQIMTSSLCRDVADYLEADRWHYPSRGEYPPTRQEVLLCLHTEKGQEIVVGYRDTESDLHEGGGYAWGWYDLGNGVFQDFVDESIQVIAWQYIKPPRKEG